MRRISKQGIVCFEDEQVSCECWLEVSAVRVVARIQSVRQRATCQCWISLEVVCVRVTGTKVKSGHGSEPFCALVRTAHDVFSAIDGEKAIILHILASNAGLPRPELQIAIGIKVFVKDIILENSSFIRVRSIDISQPYCS